MSYKIFTTGVKSGLGRYIYKTLGGFGFTRNTTDKDFERIAKGEKLDALVHCAFNSKRGFSSADIFDYTSDNILLTKKLLDIPCKKFIFISSVDVYPKNNKLHNEDEIIYAENIESLYGLSKIISESIIQKNCKNCLILRGTALLGKYSRKNSLLKILNDKKCNLTLSPESSFNYVLHSDIVDFIKISIDKDIKGVYNLASSKNIKLGEVAEIYKKDVKFGSFCYNTGEIDNKKISSVFPVFKNTSKQNIERFLEGI